MSFFVREMYLKVSFLIGIKKTLIIGSVHVHFSINLHSTYIILISELENTYPSFLEPGKAEKHGFRTNRDRKVDETQP